MNGSEQAIKRWRQTIDELRAYRAKRLDLWGDVDDITLASYVDGTCPEEERRAIEETMESKPAVRELVDFLRNMIRPIWIQQSAGEAAAFATPQESNAAGGPHRAVLCEHLRVWLDHAGQLVTDGVERLLGPARPFAVPAQVPVRTRGSSRSALRDVGAVPPGESAPTAEECCWQIPVDELGYHLTLGFKRVASPERWYVRCGISSRVDPQIAERTRFEIARPSCSPVVQSTLARLAEGYVEVASGKWEVTITVSDDVRVLPVQLGSPPS